MCGGSTIYLIHNKKRIRFWKSREIDGQVKCGSLSQDARGRWYVNLQCEVVETRRAGSMSIGIDSTRGKPLV